MGEYPKDSAWLKAMAQVDDRWREACSRGKNFDLKDVKEVLAFMEARLSKSGPLLAGTDKPTIAELFCRA